MTNKREIVGKGQYSVGEHQQFVDRKGNLVRVVRGSSNLVPVGEAYAFFDCDASKEDIEKEIPLIRRVAQTPNELELGLLRLIDEMSLNVYTGLRETRDIGMKYIMKANYPNATNSKTADELAAVLNQIYQSPFFKPGDDFRGSIYYKEKGKYISRD
ncbi:MAG: hypothetical protein AABX10_02830 [Nanoarchaeota archaeon]